MIKNGRISIRKGPPWVAVLTCTFYLVEVLTRIAAAPLDLPEVFNVTRTEGGDTFSFRGGECSRRECSGRSQNLTCTCTCPPKTPLFREDIQQCVGELSECTVAPFGTGFSAQKIPFVYLPLKGQIIYPSKAISFPGVKTPICAVSGAQFLTRNGFIDLRSSVDSDVPFSLFRDEGRTFLQWAGDQEMRLRMEGRLLVVQLLCRDVAALQASGHSARVGLGTIPKSLLGVFTPCAAFRIAGSPSRHITNVTEVLFAPNARFSEDSSSTGLTMSEYIAIGISSVLLGLIYVASVFLYLHIKKKRSKSEAESQNGNITPNTKPKREPVRKRDIEHIERDRRAAIGPHQQTAHLEDGIVKSNPLLNIERHFHANNTLKDDFLTESDECQTDDNEQLEDTDNSDEIAHHVHPTSVTVHPMIHVDHKSIYESYYKVESFPPRDENSIERLPEENVSIIETFDFREEKAESLPVGNTRRKLYFNPAYFEPRLLMDPPPAALEFLMKIREVISIAKHKMEAKRFTPSLGGIPEEDVYQITENGSNLFHIGSQRSSVMSLKRENNRRKTYCSGCPGCEKRFLQDVSPLSSDLANGMVCHNCSSSNNVSKQNSIRKWLESVPAIKSSPSSPQHQLKFRETLSLSPTHRNSQDTSSPSALGMLNSLLSLPKDTPRSLRHSHDLTSRSLHADDNGTNFIIKKKTSSVRSEPPIRTFNIPLPNLNGPIMSRSRILENVCTVTKIQDISLIGVKIPENYLNPKDTHSKRPPIDHRLPDMVSEAMVVDKHNVSQMRGFIAQRDNKSLQDFNEKSTNSKLENSLSVDYETDSLERNNISKGLHTPTDYADVSSSQTSPTLSTALPMDEEMTMRNAVYKAGSRPTSRVSNKSREKTPINEDYEQVDTNKLLQTKRDAFENHIYNFPNSLTPRPDYNLVSEVYVNNGYNFGSGPTSPSESDTSTFGKRKINPGYPRPVEQLGQLTIEVKDPPENYIKIHESDDFEPDTLDRKPSKLKIYISNDSQEKFLSDVEQKRIFKGDVAVFKNKIKSSKNPNPVDESEKINDSALGSNIHLTKHESQKFKDLNDSQDYEIIDNTDVITDTDEGRLLTLETRHCKRQRESTPPNVKGKTKPNPPDVIPIEETTNVYECPKPPRLIKLPPPPLPPKNENGRSPIPNDQENKKVVASPGRKARAPTPPTELSPGLRCPSGASVHSALSSDYEKVLPIDDPIVQVYGKTKPILPKTELKNKILKVEHDIVEEVTCGKVTCVTSKPAPKFREFQTPKAGRKLKNPQTPRKSPRDRPGSGRKPFRQIKKSNYKEDSGYLSTDSNESRQIIRKAIIKETRLSGSETDESTEDARSESGAESVETHSVFFGSFRKVPYTVNSADSGRSSDDRPASLIST